MNLFDANFLFKDYDIIGTAHPLPYFSMFEETSNSDQKYIKQCRDKASTIDPDQAAQILACSPEESTYQ